jgi:peptidoglycan/LPS O-acetylase OafA/YrhL
LLLNGEVATTGTHSVQRAQWPSLWSFNTTPGTRGSSSTALPGLCARTAYLNQVGWSTSVWVLNDLLICLTWLPLVVAAATDRPGMTQRLLAYPPVVFLGRISYGLYFWHLFVLPVLHRAAARVGVSLSAARLPIAMVYVMLTVMVSVASFYAWERPFNALKRYVSYVS